ncbi:MAG: UvrD-helicase domain-containing protein [Bacteroidales bacterium]|nr:UvrD-helicase domain-containing protein [Bacteroidales bacterium]
MDSSRFIICRASAGSGKTYTLVRQYLQLAFSAPEGQLAQRFTHILAITFTNKAANEMKGRILSNLDDIVKLGVHNDMGKEIADQLQLDDTTLRHYASTVRSAILHNYSDLAVCTIDSFMHRIVRTFAHDLNLPLNFDVYIDNSDLIQNAVDELMALAGTEGQEEMTGMLCEFAESRMSDGKSYMIERELASLAEELFKEQTPEYLKALQDIGTTQFRNIQHKMIADNRDYESQMAKIGSDGVTIYTEAGLSPEDFYRGANGAGAFFRKLANGLLPEPNSWVLAYLEGDKLGSSKCSTAARTSLEAVKPRLQEVFRKYRQLCDTEGVLYNTRRLLLKNIYALALLNKMGELVDSYAQENEIVHISDFNKRIADVVQNEPAPFIYERLGNRYWNYLIDEFQDTSRMQWQNLVPLVENGVASGHTSLVVGDGKQAIYRFRQGDVGQFISLPHVDNPLHGSLFEQPGIGLATRLEMNRRSARTIVEFNNQFFEWVIRNRFDDNEELKAIYLGHEEEPDLVQKSLLPDGYVQVGFWNPDEGTEPLYQAMLDDIRTLVDTKGYSYRDCTLIARHNTTLANISSFLTAHGVPVVSSESFLLTQSQVVMLLRSLLQYLLDGSNRVAAARVLIYLHNMGLVSRDRSVEFLNHPKDFNLDAVLQAEGLELRCDRLRSLGLYDCCEESLRMLRLDGYETAYTATFLNVVAKYAAKHRYDLAEFLEWFDEQKGHLSTSTSSDLDAVQLMTIHKAKGLQAPVILYPLLTKRNKQDSIWVHIAPDQGIPLPASLVHPSQGQHTLFDQEYNDELLKSDMDRINVLYVALTRPKDKLLVYCQKPKTEGSTDYDSLLLDYLGTRTDTTECRPGIYTLGENLSKPTKKNSEETPPNTIVPLDHLAYPDWNHRIAIANQSDTIFEKYDDAAIRRGNLLHELLAHLRHLEEADEVLATFLKRHPLDDEEATLLRNTLHNMMRQPEVAPFFLKANPCLNECSLVWYDEILRPDRIVFTPDEIWVVDFKSGQPHTDHREQVEQYCQAIAAIRHTDRVKGFLLYLGPDHCQLLPCD